MTWENLSENGEIEMVDNKYAYRQYIHIAEAFSSGKTEEANDMLKKLNLFLAIAKASSDMLFPATKEDAKCDQRFYVAK